jgi:hypothetical protein
MLKKADLQKLAKLAKIKETDLETAIKATEEVAVTIPDDLYVLTAADLEVRDTNTRNDGIKAGKEIGIKEVRTAAGLDESVGKDAGKIATAIGAKAVTDAKIEPDKKVTMLNQQVAELQKSVGDRDTEIAGLKKANEQSTLDTKILAALPKNRAGLLTDAQYLTLIKTERTFDVVDGNLVVKAGNDVVRDGSTKNPLALDKAIESLFSEKKWIDGAGGSGGSGGAGGRGGGDTNTPGKFTKRSEVVEAHEKAGKKLTGQDGIALTEQLAQLKKDNPEFDLAN